MGTIGTLQLAAHQAALQIASITFMAPLGISQAATIRVGQAYGRKNVLRSRESGFSAMMLSSIFMAIAAVIFLSFPNYLIWPFLDDSPQAQTVLEYAVTFLVFAAAFQVFDGIQVTAMGALRGVQDTHRPMIIAGIGYWLVGFPMAAFLGLATPLEGIGIWLGLAAGLFVVAILLIHRFHSMTLPRTGVTATGPDVSDQAAKRAPS
jgi:MATE family multidrug resistance protein